MDVGKLNRFVDEISEEELIYLAAYVRHKLRGREPANRLDFELRMKEMDAGKCITLEQAWKLHEALEKQGL